MDKINKYLKNKKTIYEDEIEKKYNIFGYEDEDDLLLDLNLLLNVKYKNIKYYENKKQRTKYKELKLKIKNNDCDKKINDKYNKLKQKIKKFRDQYSNIKKPIFIKDEDRHINEYWF